MSWWSAGIAAIVFVVLAWQVSAATSPAVIVHVAYEGAPQRGALCRLHTLFVHDQRLSDGGGDVTFEGVAPGKYLLECALAGYQTAKTDVVVRDADVELHVEIRLQLQEIGRSQ